MLALTHVSTRYAGGEIRDEARAIFERTELPRDFDVIDVPLPEKGEPELHRFDAAAGPRMSPGSDRERRFGWLGIWLAVASGFLAGVMLIAVLGGAKPVVRDHARTVAAHAAGARVPRLVGMHVDAAVGPPAGHRPAGRHERRRASSASSTRAA